MSTKTLNKNECNIVDDYECRLFSNVIFKLSNFLPSQGSVKDEKRKRKRIR